jgi:hypothetical protein
VHFAGKASDPRYDNKRTEMYFEAINWIHEGGVLPPGNDSKHAARHSPNRGSPAIGRWAEPGQLTMAGGRLDGIERPERASCHDRNGVDDLAANGTNRVIDAEAHGALVCGKDWRFERCR